MTAFAQKKRLSWALSLAMGIAVLASAALATSAVAAPPEQLWQAPPAGAEAAGSGAGQLSNSHGLAADPVSGHVYAADFEHSRINEFTAWGEFVKAFGWGVEDGQPELQTCTEETGCLPGLQGTGAGQIALPTGGLAVDAAGNVYLLEKNTGFAGAQNNARVQKFNPAGEFVLMFGGEVNKTTQADVCTRADLEGGDECGAGVPGTGSGELEGNPTRGAIAIGPSGTIFVGDVGRILAFNPDGTYKGEISFAGLAGYEGKNVRALAVDRAGNFYLTLGVLSSSEKNVRKLSPTGVRLEPEFTVAKPDNLAVDAAGKVYAIDDVRVLGFEPSGACFICPADEFLRARGFAGLKPQVLATSNACGMDGNALYVAAWDTVDHKANLRAFGPRPDPAICEPPERPPAITSQYAVSVEADGALLRAQINPRFWVDTRYYLEYGTGKCSEGGCDKLRPAPPGALLGSGVDAPTTTAGIFLADLAPATTYHYRFVASSGGSEGQPVRGVGGEVGLDGAEASFTTPALPSPPQDNCANEAFRAGPAASLPDCRAYEMVSPVDKNGGDIIGICSLNCFRTELNRASVDGEKFTYSSYRAFAGSPGSLFSNQYVASRGATGWSTEAISPPRRPGLFGATLEHEYDTEIAFKSFSEDLSQAWLVDSSVDPLAPGAVQGFVNVYRRDNAGRSYEALTRSEPSEFAKKHMKLEFQGRSEDGSHAIFKANAPLTPDAAAGLHSQLYEYADGALRLASVLPDGTPSSVDASAGIENPAPGNSTHGIDTLENAISADGSRIFWTAGEGLGRLYLRIDGETTIPVSAGAGARFWDAAPDGSRALYSEGGDLYGFDVESQARFLIARDLVGVAGASEDLSAVYFVSRQNLVPGATTGQPNLYLDQEGEKSFIATLSSTDTAGGAGVKAPSVTTPMPFARMTKVTPDGQTLAFVSNRPLTGYDNVDGQQGVPVWEVFLYRAGAQQLTCVSCKASGARPSGRELTMPNVLRGGTGYMTGIWAAAWLSTSENSLYSSRALSRDGNRLFFNAYDALTPRDTNGKQDVYQWEAQGSGTCASAGGCVSLISTGESPEDSTFIDASPDGRDVFFKTKSSLDPRDPGLIDVYNARAGGGYPLPPPPPTPCLGDACQVVPPPPSDTTPSSASFRGAGDPPPRGKPRCAKGKRQVKRKGRQVKRKGKARCVAKKQGKRDRKRQSRRHNRRAAR